MQLESTSSSRLSHRVHCPCTLLILLVLSLMVCCCWCFLLLLLLLLLLFLLLLILLLLLLLLLQVQMVRMADLRQHLPRDCLPQHLGGLLPLDAHSWNQQLLLVQNGRVDPVDELVGVPLEEDASVHVPGPEALRPQELLLHLGRLQRSGVHLEYEELRKEQPAGSFHCAQ